MFPTREEPESCYQDTCHENCTATRRKECEFKRLTKVAHFRSTMSLSQWGNASFSHALFHCMIWGARIRF